jgi:hypothetical protein
MTDFLLNNEGDIRIEGNDLFIGVSDQQQQERLLLTEKGNIKQFPTAGVGTRVYLESEDQAGLLSEISRQFTGDGMKVKELRIDSNGKLIINAPYENS